MRRVIALIFLTMLLAGCPGGGSGDDPECTTGCVDDSDNCVAGTSDNACGQGGTACSVCSGGLQCGDGMCAAPPACSPSNCSTCCDGDTYVQVADDDCGSGGYERSTCDVANGGYCDGDSCVAGCGPQICAGCCDGSNDCVAGTSDVECGTGGDYRLDCSGDSCQNGSCRIAATAGIIPEPTDLLRVLRGVGGREVVFARQVARLEIGTTGIDDFEVEVGSMDYGFSIGGILGMDFPETNGRDSQPERTVAESRRVRRYVLRAHRRGRVCLGPGT